MCQLLLRRGLLSYIYALQKILGPIKLERMYMGKKLLALVLTFSSLLTFAQQRPGSLRGTVTDAVNGETIPFANVVIKDAAGNIVKGGTTDFDGAYNLNPVAPGTYDVEVSFTGYAKITLQDILISPNNATIQNFKMKEASEVLGEVTLVYERPLIDPTKSSTVTTQEDILNMAVRDVGSIAIQSAGVTQNAGGGTNIRGSRDEGTVYFIDGVKVRGNVNLPQAAIAQTEVITGGLPAQYGDATGGVISTTTRGPSPEYFGTVEVLTSAPFQFIKFNADNPYYNEERELSSPTYKRAIDGQNYNLGAFTIGGPLLQNVWKDKSGNPKLGFLFSSELLYIDEPRTGVVPFAQLDEDLMEDMKERPIVLDAEGDNFLYRSELVTEDDFTNVQNYKNNYNQEARFNSSVQLKTSQNTVLTLGGRWVYQKDKRSSFNNHIFNYFNNLDQTGSDWSTYMRFQQNFANDEESLIQNAFYTIQLDYSQVNLLIEEADHGDNFFEYGHVGKFDIQERPVYIYGQDEKTGLNAWLFENYDDTAIVFTPGTANPVLSNYMKTYYEFAANDNGGNFPTDDFTVLQSEQTPPINGQNPLTVYDRLWGNIGSVQGFSALSITGGRANYFKRKNAQFRITGSSSFDIKKHSLIVGFEYEQRTDREYALDATDLWSRARLLQNRPNGELDLDNPIPLYKGGQFQDTIDYNYKYNPEFASQFAENVRRALGMNPYSTERVNIDNLDPSQLSIDMFSAGELIDPNAQNTVAYFGYDYLGNIINDNPSISDFFNETDENGRLTRPVAPFQPIYIAGYIQDQFTFRDLTFNVGVRVDRFDLNQDVLKDPYVLYPHYTVADLGNSPLASENLTIPANIGGDYRVYVDSYDDPNYIGANIIGYGKDDNFYDANGRLLEDPSILSDLAGGGIKPFTIKTPDTRAQDNQGVQKIPAESFEDYDPQTVVMPRVAFNFPITEQALFIAHYDLLAQRPSTGISRLDPFDYLDLINNRAPSTVNNPDLKPQRITEYELGFKQVLTEQSALKIAAFYREQKDLLQTVAFVQAYPIQYVAFGNRDFGTVKGLTLEYELRRTGNVKIDANYTLQFANGTGSSATSGLNLARTGQPNLRYILPVSFDNRHQFLLRFDYRYGSGANYTGPVVKNSNILENFGVNVTLSGTSGAPYTKRDSPYIITNTNPSSTSLVEGQINGSRLPWQVTVDMRVNKVFKLSKERNANSIEVYVQALNLFNTHNVIDVYNFTGSADDDGYLASPSGQSSLAERTSAESFVDLYNRSVINPFNYAAPRRLRLGVAYNF